MHSGCRILRNWDYGKYKKIFGCEYFVTTSEYFVPKENNEHIVTKSEYFVTKRYFSPFFFLSYTISALGTKYSLLVTKYSLLVTMCSLQIFGNKVLTRGNKVLAVKIFQSERMKTIYRENLNHEECLQFTKLIFWNYKLGLSCLSLNSFHEV